MKHKNANTVHWHLGTGEAAIKPSDNLVRTVTVRLPKLTENKYKKLERHISSVALLKRPQISGVPPLKAERMTSSVPALSRIDTH